MRGVRPIRSRMETPISGAAGPGADMGSLSTTSPVGDYNLKPLTFASRAGGWLFKRRSWLPLPLVAAGEGVRLWGVHHIGAVSRTRSDRLGPLIVAGPFARVRNPLYIGNILLWTGFAISARLLWLAPIIVVLLVLEYHAIVRWEEDLLCRRMGEPYARYLAEVPRWLPSFRP